MGLTGLIWGLTGLIFSLRGLIQAMKRLDLSLGALGDVWMDGWTDRGTSGNSPLCPTGHRPFGAAAQKGWPFSQIQLNLAITDLKGLTNLMRY